MRSTALHVLHRMLHKLSLLLTLACCSSLNATLDHSTPSLDGTSNAGADGNVNEDANAVDEGLLDFGFSVVDDDTDTANSTTSGTPQPSPINMAAFNK